MTPRVKFFVWLILLDRLNTKSTVVRRNLHIQSNSFCVLCFDWEDETIDHLFFDCLFTKRCWGKLQINWTNDADIHERIIHSINLAGMPFFMEIFLIAAWEL